MKKPVSFVNPHREPLTNTCKQVGTVIEAFRLNHHARYNSIMPEYTGRAAIGHVRHATCGPNDRSYAQPRRRVEPCAMQTLRVPLLFLPFPDTLMACAA